MGHLSGQSHELYDVVQGLVTFLGMIHRAHGCIILPTWNDFFGPICTIFLERVVNLSQFYSILHPSTSGD